LDLGDQHIWARYKDHATFEVSFVPQVVYAKVVAKVIKLKCAFVVEKLISKLRNRFPFYELMEALRVVYPQYSLGFDLKTSFQLHLNVNKNVYCVPKKCGPKKVLISLILDPIVLNMQ
jgi:hypothetical protein